MQELRQEDFGITDDELKELEQNYQYSEDEEKKAVLRELIELQRKKKELSFMEMKLKIQLSDPEETKKVKEIVTKKHKTILENELTQDNFTDIHKICTTEEEEMLYDKRKNMPLSSIPEILSTFKEHEVQKGMQKENLLDLRKQRHKKKPSDYLGNLALAKLSFDLSKRIDRLEKEVALQNSINQEKFEALGLAVVDLQANKEISQGLEVDLEKKVKFLLDLGVDVSKLVVYKASVLQPHLTQEDLGKLAKKSRKTVRSWLKETEALLTQYQMGKNG